jgi:hypothetical protein
MFLLVPLLLHMTLWVGAGLAGGLAYAIGRGARFDEMAAVAIAGAVGALFGTLVFEMAGAFFFPFDHTADPISGTASTRLLARLCVVVFVGLATIRALSPARPGVAKAAGKQNDL